MNLVCWKYNGEELELKCNAGKWGSSVHKIKKAIERSGRLVLGIPVSHSFIFSFVDMWATKVKRTGSLSFLFYPFFSALSQDPESMGLQIQWALALPLCLHSFFKFLYFFLCFTWNSRQFQSPKIHQILGLAQVWKRHSFKYLFTWCFFHLVFPLILLEEFH